jgi:hypothetical protein
MKRKRQKREIREGRRVGGDQGVDWNGLTNMRLS